MPLLKTLCSPFVKNETAWRLLNASFLRLARKLDSWRRGMHGPAESIDSAANAARYYPDGRVRRGVFAGMHYPEMEAAGSAIFPKLAGCYESELQPLLERIVRTPYRTIVDVGCAEGYYAVGLAMRMPDIKVLAFDVDPRARDLCRRMAEANGVAARVELRTACSPAVLAALPRDERALVISDCEGYELRLFTPEAVRALAGHDVLIEVHDFVNVDTGIVLRQRFAATHRAASIVSSEDADKPALTPIPEIASLASATQQHLMAEGRPARMEWLCFTPWQPA